MLLKQIGLCLPKKLAFRMQQMWFVLRRYSTEEKAHSTLRVRSKHDIRGNVLAKTVFHKANS